MSHKHLQQTLKKSLKARKISYKDLGRKLKMSESGVKKMLASPDISLSRLRSLAGILEISLTNLIRLSEEGAIEEVHLTEKQEEALVREPALFRFYWKYAIEKNSEEEIAARYDLSKKEIQNYFKKLEQLGLRLREFRLFRWVSEGPLLQKINREWSEMTMLRSLFLPKTERSGCHRLIYLRLSKRSQEELVIKLNEVLDDFVHRSEREELAYAKNELSPTSVLLGVVPQDFVDRIK